MSTEQSRKIVAVVSDLMFMVKIQSAAKSAGFEINFSKTSEDAMEQARTRPAVILLDLNTTTMDPLRFIESLKGDQDTRDTPLVGFVSHVQTTLIKAAQERGCDTVLARSAFSQNLPAILQRYA